MDNRPIGVFDSGIGGLPVLYKLAKAFPNEDFIYLGDNSNVPYGVKSRSEISALTENNLIKLASLNVKLIVIACNTASASIGDAFSKRKIFKIGITENGVKRFNGKGAFLATPFTVERVLKNAPELTKNLDFFPLPGLSTDIETDPFSDDEKFTYRIKKEISDVLREVNCTDDCKEGEETCFSDHLSVPRDHFCLKTKKYDFLYLGCTHYLFKERELKNLFGVEKCFDGTRELIEKINIYIENSGMFADNIQSIDFVGKWAEKNAAVFARYVGECCRS